MTRRTPTRRPTHPFQAEQGVTDYLGIPMCGYPGCGQPRTNRAHQLAGVDPAVTAAEHRKLGERTEREEPA